MNCKHCKADCARRGEDREKECRGHIPMTNADRIRALSDEELAHELKAHGFAFAACSEKAWLEWLQQPAEEGEHE